MGKLIHYSITNFTSIFIFKHSISLQRRKMSKFIVFVLIISSYQFARSENVDVDVSDGYHDDGPLHRQSFTNRLGDMFGGEGGNMKLDIRLDAINFIGFRERERERGMEREMEREVRKMSFASLSAPLSQTLRSGIDSRIISFMHPLVISISVYFY